ncbi:MAG: hypothetical protein JNM93_13285 [Bacteriovoracaceae bacterium]|nr:hypothetical protein [Bacteriovoracaceae bacterium]
MKLFTIILVSLFSALSLAQNPQEITVNNPFHVIETSESEEIYQLTINKKNAIYMGYNHGLAGVAYHRNYYNYATAYVFSGKRYNPELTGVGAGIEWTLSNSTLEDGWYVSPSAIYFMAGSNNNLGPNDSYASLYGVSLREKERALGLSLSVTHKWLFLHSNSKSMVLALGPEFLRLRSNFGMGLVANLGIIF